MTSRAQIAVVVVTFEPDDGFSDRLRAMRLQGSTLIVVDNSQESEKRRVVDRAATANDAALLRNANNRGLAAALNQGFHEAMRHDCDWVLLFDQDSCPAPNMADELLRSLENHPHSDQVAVMGSNILETGAASLSHRWLRPHPWLPGMFAKVRIHERDFWSVTMVITSGSLVRMEDFRRVGSMEERLFIDHVDTDFCLRCRKAKRLIGVSAKARLFHAFGMREARSFAGIRFHPTNHAAFRHYYMARNRIFLFRRHAWRFPHWTLFEIAAAGLMTLRILTVETDKRAKLRAAVIGYADGIRGRFGPCASPTELGHKTRVYW